MQIRQELEAILKGIPHFSTKPTQNQLNDRKYPLMYFYIEIKIREAIETQIKAPEAKEPDFKIFISRKQAQEFYKKIIYPYLGKLKIITRQGMYYQLNLESEETEINSRELEHIYSKYDSGHSNFRHIRLGVLAERPVKISPELSQALSSSRN